MNRKDGILAEIAVFPSRSGLPTAVHVDSGALLHSAVNPQEESRSLAAKLVVHRSGGVVLLGGGLGYLAESFHALPELRGRVQVVEPDPGLYALARSCRPDSLYAQMRDIPVHFASTMISMQRASIELPEHAQLVVAPYFVSLSRVRRHPLSGFVQMLRAERASGAVYGPLIKVHATVNRPRLAAMPAAIEVELPEGLLPIVVGAGPSLERCAKLLKEARNSLVIISVSGAVPALVAKGIHPDWIVAFEARESIVADMNALRSAANVIVFPSTKPEILSLSQHAFYSGDFSGGEGLRTRGGSSAIPALDFALRSSGQDVVLVGVDLSVADGNYAGGVLRDERASLEKEPPKFESMRAGMEMVLAADNCPQRRIWHVTPSRRCLQGCVRITPESAEHDISNLITEVCHD